MSVPTIYETHEAKHTYVEGMAANYPGLDPRISLLGMTDDGMYYKTVAYGYMLVPVPSRFAVIARETFTITGIVAILLLCTERFWG